MKRLIPFVLAMLLLLSACGGGGDAPTAKPADPETVRTEAPTTEAPATEPPFQEIPLLDAETCALTVTNITLDDVWGYTFYLRCENRSESTQLFSVPDASCRGWLLSPDVTVSVGPGETKESQFNIWLSSLERCGLEALDELRLHLIVRDMNNYSGDPFAEEVLVLYPTGKTAEEITPAPAREAGEKDVSIADNDDFAFTICGRDEDNIWTYNLVLCVENKTEQDLTFSWKDVSVNGSPTDALWFYYTIPAGLRACFPIYFDEDTMKAAGVESIETVDFTLVVTPATSFTALYREAHSYSAN